MHRPIELQRSGYIGSISYNGQNVNIVGVPFAEIIREVDPGTEDISDEEFQERYGLKLRAVDEDAGLGNGVRETAGPPVDMIGAKENTAEYGGERYSADDDTDNKYLQSANLTEEEIQSGIRVREFIDDVSGMINKAIRSKRKQKIGPVSQQHASVVNSIIRKINPNFSAEGYELWIDGTGAAHIEDRHGEHGKQDRSMASDEAKMLIPWASQNASGGDFLRDSKGNIRRSVRYFNRDQSRAPEIYLEKKIDDDTVYVSECVPDSENKRIWITSAYIKKGSNGQMLNMEESSPQPTPEAPFDGNATTYIVASAEQNVKNQEKDVFEMTDEEFQERYGLKLRAVDEVENGPDSQTFGENQQGSKEQFSVDDSDFTKEHGNFRGMTDSEISVVQNVGRKSVNSFNSADIKATERLAQQYWKEMGVKSPFFRAWFGDWRANDQTPIQVANQRGDARGIQRNADTGWEINVSGKVFAESKHFATKNTHAIPYLPYINDIVQKAILLDSSGIEIGKAKSHNSLLMHSLYAVADIGNGPEVLKLYVEEMNNPGTERTAKRAYQLQNIEKASVVNGGVQRKSPSSLANTTNAIKTVADLFAAVKRYDSNFAPNPPSKAVNKDGTPKIYYHGTDASWTVYDLQKNVNQVWGEGIYLAETEERARLYGDNVMPLYVRALYDNRDAKRLGATKDHTKMKNGDILVFSPEQIKSATDNIGTFDADNPDIRYSVDDGAELTEDDFARVQAARKAGKSLRPMVTMGTIDTSNMVVYFNY